MRNGITQRTLHLRYAGLCLSLLVLLAVIARRGGVDTEPLWRAAMSAPLAFAGTFLFNMLLVRHADDDRAAREQVPTDRETRVWIAAFSLTFSIGLACWAVAAYAPLYLPGIKWVAPVLGGIAGIHLAAFLRSGSGGAG